MPKSNKPKLSKPAPKAFSAFQYPDVLVTKPNNKAIPVIPVFSKDFDKWIKTQSESVKSTLHAQGFNGGTNNIAITFAKNNIESVFVGVGKEIGLYTFSTVADTISKSVSTDLAAQDFILDDKNLTPQDLENACIGWSLAAYSFDAYKKNGKKNPRLVWPKHADRKRVTSFIQSISLIRNLINLPPNDLGPAELAAAAKKVAAGFKSTARITEDKKLLTDNFPMIYAVGDGSERRPRLIDFTWGNSKHPKITLVGKGVVFDTGGYDIKPSSAMLLMKKDMGGAAMALGLAWMIMSLKLPVRLRVLIPAVENSISGIAYRPSDVLTSRKGLTVEIGNTDAEGRLVMADCLTLACEEKPELLFDFSTLTGAARTALGFEIPAMFSNNDEIARDLQQISLEVNDPLWQMPLWANYKNDIVSPVADLNNSGNNPAGAITAALFLQSFVTDNTDWVHIDHYAWEASGKAGRPRGGADTGMRATFAYLEQRYGQKKKKSRRKNEK